MLIQIIPRQPTPTPTPQTTLARRIDPAQIVVTHRPLKVLDFDIENRPLTYLGSDFTTAEVTAIAWAWCDRPEDVTCMLLGEVDPVTMLERFVAAYNDADMVTGHYITGHDLPHINAALMEARMPTLDAKLVQDTKTSLVRRKGISGSQESLAGMLLLQHDKVQMNQTKWRAANRLTREGLAETKKRVVGDVQQHIEMRAKLLELGYLGPPRRWSGGTADAEPYTP
jgi:hypothetical protein